MPETIGIGSVRAQSFVKAPRFVAPSKPRPDGDVPVVVPVTGTRGSFAEANGSAFLMMPRRVEAVADRPALRARVERPDLVAARRERERRISAGSSSARSRPRAAASANLPWSIRTRALAIDAELLNRDRRTCPSPSRERASLIEVRHRDA